MLLTGIGNILQQRELVAVALDISRAVCPFTVVRRRLVFPYFKVLRFKRAARENSLRTTAEWPRLGNLTLSLAPCPSPSLPVAAFSHLSCSSVSVESEEPKTPSYILAGGKPYWHLCARPSVAKPVLALGTSKGVNGGSFVFNVVLLVPQQGV